MVRIPPNLPRRSLFLVMAFVCCVLRGSMPAQDFIRGDQTGDGLVGVNDVVHLMNYLYTGGPAATNGCGGPFTFDISDVNDNEFLTIADPLKMGEALFIMGTIPEPYPACGPDPTSGSAGFDQVDPAYVVRTVGPYDGVDTSGVVPVRTAGFEVALEIPGPVRAVEFYFGYDPAELSNPQYEGDLPLGVDVVAFGVLRVTLTSALDPLDLPAGIQRLGRIVFEVAPGVLLPTIDWVPTFADTIFRRATVVDDDLADHHPTYEEIDAPVFIRGDLDANGQYTIQDLIIWISVYGGNPTTLVSQCDGGPTEGMDVNDNEYVTTADYLLLGGDLFCGAPGDIPFPNNCGVDPTAETYGFEVVDPAYAIRATKFTLIGAGPVERDVEIPIKVLSPEPVRAIEFTLDLGTPLLTLDDPFFEPAGTLVGPISANRQEGQLLHVVIGSTCDPILPMGSTEWQDLGILKLHLDDVELPNPIEMLPEATLGTTDYRATVVTLDFQDHHPLLLAGEREFQRGNANNQGLTGPVDIGDPIFLLNYLSGVGPPPECLDAADANDDGKLDIGDPIYLLNYIVGQLPPMPDPFPQCGYEFDIDELNCETYTCL